LITFLSTFLASLSFPFLSTHFSFLSTYVRIFLFFLSTCTHFSYAQTNPCSLPFLTAHSNCVNFFH
jgi:hypothetical protein